MILGFNYTGKLIQINHFFELYYIFFLRINGFLLYSNIYFIGVGRFLSNSQLFGFNKYFLLTKKYISFNYINIFLNLVNSFKTINFYVSKNQFTRIKKILSCIK